MSSDDDVWPTVLDKVSLHLRGDVILIESLIRVALVGLALGLWEASHLPWLLVWHLPWLLVASAPG